MGAEPTSSATPNISATALSTGLGVQGNGNIKGWFNLMIYKLLRDLATSAEKGDVGVVIWRFFRHVVLWLSVIYGFF